MKIPLAFHLLVSYYVSYQWLKCTKSWTKFASGFHETEHACGAKRWGLCERRCKSVSWRYYSRCINFCPLHDPVLWHILSTSSHYVFICAEIAAKQGHGDVSKLTPTDIAIEVLYHHCSIDTLQCGHSSCIFALIWNHSAFQALLQVGNFVNEHPTIHSQVGDLQVDSHSRRVQTL